MKILHLLSQVELTGAEVYAVTLAEWQKQNGHDVIIISDQIHQKTEIPFFPLPIHRTNFWTRRQSKKKLLNYLVQNKIDIVHAHSRAAVRVAYSSCKNAGCPLVTTLHGRPHRSWSKKIFDIYGDRVISICENLTTDLLQNMKLKADKISTISNLINFEKINVKRPRSDRKFRLALIGRTSGPKGQRVTELLTQVFPDLLKELPLLEIILVGGNVDHLSAEGQSQFQQLKNLYPQRISNLTHVPGLEAHLQDYDLIIGAGRVAMAALACKIPLWSMGEAENLSLVTPENYERAKASNFGDIHHEFLYQPMDCKNLIKELKSLVTAKTFLNVEQLDDLQKKSLHDFGLHRIASRILNVYKSALFKKKVPAWIPVLMYHKVTDQELQTRHRIFVTKETFTRHLKFFKQQGFQTLSFRELKEFRDLKKDFREFPKRPLVLTFDDGYVNNLENAVPLLKQFGFKATFFLLADTSIRANSWDKADGTPQLPLMTKEQRALLHASGQEIGSHGFSHEKLSQKNKTQTWHELQESKKILEQEFGCEIPVYAYTYGIKNEFAETAAEEAGYTYAVNTTTGGLHLEDNPYSIFRVSIFPEDGPRELRKKTSSWYRRYFYLKRRQ